jgi:PAS domain S-box-containing protein
MGTLPNGSSHSACLTGMLCSSRGEFPDDTELLEAMVEGASEGLVVLNSDGLILRANRSAAEMIGYDRDRIVGRPIQDVLFKTAFDATFLSEIVATSLAVSRTYDLADGRSILVSGRAVAAGAVVLTLRDETGMKQLVRRTQGAVRAGKPGWAELRRTAANATDGVPIVTSSLAMRSVRDKALQCATVDSPVLLFGETGTGKGVFAKLIHEASARHAGPFYVVNCGAIPEGLLEAELFGYARGAFTGADPRGKAGLIELAHTGTLLLDEIGDMPLGLQVKLLRFLESGEVWPVGASKGKRPDVRIIAATHRDLGQMIGEGSFRKDLYYRLHVLSLHIPPLREHPEDIPPLVAMMLDQLEQKLGRRKRIAPQTLEAICERPLPGNVRELWNLVESLAVTVAAEIIETTDLPEHAARTGDASAIARLERVDGNLRQALRKIEAQIVQETLQRYGTQSKAAQHLGVAQATIARKSKRYGLGA